MRYVRVLHDGQSRQTSVDGDVLVLADRFLSDTAAVVPNRPELGYRVGNALIGYRAAIRVPLGVTGPSGSVAALVLAHAPGGVDRPCRRRPQTGANT